MTPTLRSHSLNGLTYDMPSRIQLSRTLAGFSAEGLEETLYFTY